MKINKLIYCLIVQIVFLSDLSAQPPAGIYYQVLAKDVQGNPARNRVVHVKNAIIQGSLSGGTIVYEETHTVKSNNDGVFEIIIGKGTKTAASLVDSITLIKWGNGPFFFNMKMAVAPTIPASWWTAANNYIDLGTTQMMSVPYALYAGNASVTNVSTNITPGPRNTFLTTDSLGNVNWTSPQAANVNVTQVTNFNLSLSVGSGQNINIPPNTTAVVTVPLPGVKKGDPVFAAPQGDYPEWSVYGAWVGSDNVVSIRFANFTADPVTILGSQYKIVVIK